MILLQKPPENFIKISIKNGNFLWRAGFHPMYKWDGFYYFSPSDEISKYIKEHSFAWIGGE